MKSLNTYKLARGFTLIEVVIVVALFSILLGIGLLLSMDVYRSTLHRSGRELLLDTLSLARMRAFANEGTGIHGVCSDPPDLIIFGGATYNSSDPTNERVLGAATIRYESEDNFFTCDREGIIFSPLSAATEGGRITVVETDRPDLILTINAEGAFLW